AGHRNERERGADRALRIALLERRDALQRSADRAVAGEHLSGRVERAVDVAVRECRRAVDGRAGLALQLRVARAAAATRAAVLVERLERARREVGRVARLRRLRELLARSAADHAARIGLLAAHALADVVFVLRLRVVHHLADGLLVLRAFG